jgi:23S rRNA A1618 N6-methylase RlmF
MHDYKWGIAFVGMEIQVKAINSTKAGVLQNKTM